MRPAVFLDRDDTLMAANGLPAPRPPAQVGDVTDPELVALLPGVLEGCGRLRAAGFALVVVSNQGVVARGGATLERVHQVHDRLLSLLHDPTGGGGGGWPLIEAVYFCPYHPKGSIPEFTREHPWRKPQPGMILAAAEELGLDLTRSWLIGDARRDIEAGVAAGLPAERCLLVEGGGGNGGDGRLDFGGAVSRVLAGGDAGATGGEP